MGPVQEAFGCREGSVAFAISNRSGQPPAKLLIQSDFGGILAINVNPDRRRYRRLTL
jgi:hypothetical protein